jgi:hypothetical protein
MREVVDHDVEHEPVELRLRQGIGAFELDRVLGREHEERLLEGVGLALHGHAVLLHRLQEGGLRLGRRAVDLVGQDDVAEDRAGHEDEMAAAGLGILLDDVGPGDVGRHQVRRELDAGELEVQHLGQGVDDEGLGQAGHARDDAVAADEQRDQHLLDHVVLADDQLAQLVHDAVAALLHALGQERRRPSRPVTGKCSLAVISLLALISGGEFIRPLAVANELPPETPRRAPPLRGAALTGWFAWPHRARIHDGALAAKLRAFAFSPA